jgi:oxygen-dependent protoporphyrinogen oxidase
MIGTFDTERREVTVVGAGIAGMLAAYQLDKKGYDVTLLEERDSAGGLLQTVRTEYGMAERAAHSLLASSAVEEFCRELGVELAEIRPDSRARFIVRDGRLRKFPLSVGETIGALKHAAFARASANADSLDLDSWGRTHLGDAAVDYLLTPFVRGIYGVQPADLGVKSAFPSLSVAAGQTFLGTMLDKALRRHSNNGNKHHRSNGNGNSAHDEQREKARKRMVAPRWGMGDLTARLERHLEKRLGGRFRRGVRVDAMPTAPNVVIATPAYAAAKLLEPVAPLLGRALSGIKYTPIVSITAFVPAESLSHPVKGVGVLVPAKEGRKSLGILFTSSSFEGRVYDETRYAAFTVLLGGSLQPGWVNASDREISDAVREELATLLGVEGEPAQVIISRWPRAIPQYSTLLPGVWRTARETWCTTPGRVLFGNYTGQVSLRGMIESSAASSKPCTDLL